jgi:hypothetical protein
VTEANTARESQSSGPICTNCRQPIRKNLRYEQIGARSVSENEPQSPTVVTFCGSCGWTLSVDLARSPFLTDRHPQNMEVVVLEDETTLDGQFQLRCRELIGEISALGFKPGGWIGLINTHGAAGAAKYLLSSHRILPVTHWLVDNGRVELTMEQAIVQPKWTDLFTNEERTEATHRLAIAGRHRPGPDALS